MVFHSFAFFKFFLLIYFFALAFGVASKNFKNSSLPHTLNKTFLLIASYYFYAHWDVRFLSLIILSTSIAYFSGLLISKTTHKKLFLAISLVLNLTILSFFKYYNFFIENFNILTSNFGLSFPLLNIILPVGISFYIFQSMSYSLDVYYETVNPTKNFFDVALYISFFPQLMAGPIVRAKQFLPQLQRYSPPTLKNFTDGVQVFLFGLFLKVVVADNIAPIVDPIFADPSSQTSSVIWLAVFGYSIQIFCDFGGYSEMAIGLAMVFGYTLPQNFNAPYMALNIGDFWHRWHISLSNWFRDHLFYPLHFSNLIIFSDKSRDTLYRAAVNLLIAMGLIGLWHGANWTYVLFGLYHGIGLTINRILTAYRVYKRPSIKVKLISWAGTFLFVVSGFVLFRAENLILAGEIYSKMFFWESGFSLGNFQFDTIVYLFIFIMAIQFWQFKRNSEKFIFKLDSIAFFTYIFLLVNLIFLFSPRDPVNFIYFQF